VFRFHTNTQACEHVGGHDGGCTRGGSGDQHERIGRAHAGATYLSRAAADAEAGADAAATTAAHCRANTGLFPATPGLNVGR